MIHSVFRTLFILFCGAAALSGCCLVDEDLRDCNTEHKFRYELHLITNFDTELQEVLGKDEDRPVREALRNDLKGVFTDFGQDLDLSFFATGLDSTRLFREQVTMNANRSEISLFLPERPYLHTSVANVAENGIVSLSNEGRRHLSSLRQKQETADPHRTGLFTGRMPLDGVSLDREMGLYMANCAAALVVNTSEEGFRSMTATASGFADSFSICDSIFRYSEPVLVSTKQLSPEEGDQRCFVTVNFPSRDYPATRSVTETTEPFRSENAPEALWHFRTYVTLADNSVTETTLGVTKPLRAGQLMILKAKVLPDGSVQPHDPTVGMSVVLDWGEGIGGDIEL